MLRGDDFSVLVRLCDFAIAEPGYSFDLKWKTAHKEHGPGSNTEHDDDDDDEATNHDEDHVPDPHLFTHNKIYTCFFSRE